MTTASPFTPWNVTEEHIPQGYAVADLCAAYKILPKTEWLYLTLETRNCPSREMWSTCHVEFDVYPVKCGAKLNYFYREGEYSIMEAEHISLGETGK